MLAVPLCFGIYSHVGISIAQARTGSHELFAPATGTTFYDDTLILAPFTVVTGTLAGIAVLSIVMAVTGRWRDTWVWVCPASAIIWILFMVCMFPRWEDVSP
jgi:hypothetical protein